MSHPHVVTGTVNVTPVKAKGYVQASRFADLKTQIQEIAFHCGIDIDIYDEETTLTKRTVFFTMSGGKDPVNYAKGLILERCT